MTRVYTKQNIAVLEQLEATGRYVAKRKYVQNDLDDDAEMMAIVYDELVKNHPRLEDKPEDAEVPVWVSFSLQATMCPERGFVILELEVPDTEITHVNIAKWGQMLNYGYLPENDEDRKRHRDLMEQYGVDDATAVMTNFYPMLKKEILNSWSRLFDDSVSLGSDASYGLLWEIKKELVFSIDS
jgi:hypothetical protein